MGKITKEIPIPIKPLNTTVPALGLEFGELSEANDVRFTQLGKQLMATARAPLFYSSLTVSAETRKIFHCQALNYTDDLACYYSGSFNGIKKMSVAAGTTGATGIAGLPYYCQNNSFDYTPSFINFPIIDTTSNKSKNATFMTVRLDKTVTESCDTAWTSYGTEAAAATADTTNYVEGSGSSKCVVTASNNKENGQYKNITWTRGAKISTAVGTLVGEAVYFKLYIDTLTNIGNIRVTLCDEVAETNTSYWDITTQYTGMALVVGWNTISVNLSSTATGTTGTGLGTSLARIKIGIITINGINTNYILNIDDVRLVDRTFGLHYTLNGTTWTKVTSTSQEIPPFNKIMVFQNRLIGIYKNHMYWSNINDGSDWTTSTTDAAKDSSYLNYDDGDNDEFVGGITLPYETLLLFKRYSIHRVKPIDNDLLFQREPIYSGSTTGIGCIAPETIACMSIQVPQSNIIGNIDYIFFSSHCGPMMISTVGSAVPIGLQIQPTIDTFYGNCGTAPETMFCVKHNRHNQWWLSNRSSQHLVYNVLPQCWSIYNIGEGNTVITGIGYLPASAFNTYVSNIFSPSIPVLISKDGSVVPYDCLLDQQTMGLQIDPIGLGPVHYNIIEDYFSNSNVFVSFTPKITLGYEDFNTPRTKNIETVSFHQRIQNQKMNVATPSVLDYYTKLTITNEHGESVSSEVPFTSITLNATTQLVTGGAEDCDTLLRIGGVHTKLSLQLPCLGSIYNIFMEVNPTGDMKDV